MHILQRIIPRSCVVLLSFRSLILLFPRYKFIIGLELPTLAIQYSPRLLLQGCRRPLKGPARCDPGLGGAAATKGGRVPNQVAKPLRLSGQLPKPSGIAAATAAKAVLCAASSVADSKHCGSRYSLKCCGSVSKSDFSS
jgi:hypothetical protein